MIAALPMYDWPELRSQTDAFWQDVLVHLKDAGIEAPIELTRDKPQFEIWTAQDLLIAQTCGYPLATALRGKVHLVGAPHYGVEGCGPGTYSSAIVMQRGVALSSIQETKGLRLAFNSDDSLSGYRCLVPEIGDPTVWFGSLHHSGSHRASARLVADGAADIAVLDALCWHYLQRFDPACASALTVLGWTGVMPSLPFIARLETSQSEMVALRDSLNAASKQTAGKALGFLGIREANLADYDPLSVL